MVTWLCQRQNNLVHLEWHPKSRCWKNIAKNKTADFYKKNLYNEVHFILGVDQKKVYI